MEKLLSWAEPHRRLGVRANADTPEDAQRARAFGAEGIGLCRTEHMFFREDRLPWVRRLILAETPEEEALALERLFHFQKEDFKEILRAMDGLPVTVRLLDPPLHEFLPPLEALARRAEEGDEEAGRLLRRAEALKEANPMLGFRGARLLLLRPGVFRMQLRALLEAARELKEAGHDPRPEVMVPLVADPKEVERARALAEELFREYGPIPFGTMVETPGPPSSPPRSPLWWTSSASAPTTSPRWPSASPGTTRGSSCPGTWRRGFSPLTPRSAWTRRGGAASQDGGGGGEEGEPQAQARPLRGARGEAGSVRFVADLLDYTSASPFRVLTARLAAAQAGLSRALKPA